MGVLLVDGPALRSGNDGDADDLGLLLHVVVADMIGRALRLVLVREGTGLVAMSSDRGTRTGSGRGGGSNLGGVGLALALAGLGLPEHLAQPLADASSPALLLVLLLLGARPGGGGNNNGPATVVVLVVVIVVLVGGVVVRIDVLDLDGGVLLLVIAARGAPGAGAGEIELGGLAVHRRAQPLLVPVVGLVEGFASAGRIGGGGPYGHGSGGCAADGHGADAGSGAPSGRRRTITTFSRRQQRRGRRRSLPVVGPRRSAADILEVGADVHIQSVGGHVFHLGGALPRLSHVDPHGAGRALAVLGDGPGDAGHDALLLLVLGSTGSASVTGGAGVFGVTGDTGGDGRCIATATATADGAGRRTIAGRSGPGCVGGRSERSAPTSGLVQLVLRHIIVLRGIGIVLPLVQVGGLGRDVADVELGEEGLGLPGRVRAGVVGQPLRLLDDAADSGGGRISIVSIASTTPGGTAGRRRGQAFDLGGGRLTPHRHHPSPLLRLRRG